MQGAITAVIALGLVVLLALLYALVLAPYEQRNALRVVLGRTSAISDRQRRDALGQLVVNGQAIANDVYAAGALWNSADERVRAGREKYNRAEYDAWAAAARSTAHYAGRGLTNAACSSAWPGRTRSRTVPSPLTSTT